MGAATTTIDEDKAASFSGRRITSRKAAVTGLASLPPEEARVRAIAEVVNGLIQGVQEGKDVDLNQLKAEVGGWAGREVASVRIAPYYYTSC